MMKIKLKFKTKEELIEQYGDNWRSKRQYHWVEYMDYLLGTEIDEKYFIKFINNKGEFIMRDRQEDIIYIQKSSDIYDCWKVYLYQIKVTQNKIIDYNTPRKLIYD